MLSVSNFPINSEVQSGVCIISMRKMNYAPFFIYLLFWCVA